MASKRFKDSYLRGDRSSPTFDKETLTDQNFKKECDINCIVSQFDSTGLLTHVNDISNAHYDDFTNVKDYKTSLDRVFAAQESFMELPPKIREEFDNSVEKFLTSLNDPAKKERLVEIGVFEPPPQPEDPPISDLANPPKVDDANSPS